MCIKYIRIWIDNNYDDDKNVVDVCVGGWLIVYKDKRQKGKNKNVGTWWSWWCLIMSIEKKNFFFDWLIDWFCSFTFKTVMDQSLHLPIWWWWWIMQQKKWKWINQEKSNDLRASNGRLAFFSRILRSCIS